MRYEHNFAVIYSAVVISLLVNSYDFPSTRETALGLYSLKRRHLTDIGIHIINLRRFDDRLRFIMWISIPHKQRVLMHRHQGWNVRHGLCHIYMRYIYIYIWVAYSFFVLLFVHCCNVMVYVVYCVASGNQEKVQTCLVTLWLFIMSCHSLYKTTLGSLCSWKPAWSLKKHPHSMCLNPLWKCVSLWLSKSFGRYANIENNDDDDDDDDGDPCKNALTAPEPGWYR